MIAVTSLAALLLAAPASAEDAPAATPPASVAAVRPLLAARHPGDLPGRSTLDHHPDAASALRWLAAHGDSLVEAERALMLLALYPDATNAAACTEILLGPHHAKIRSGAARCLATQPLAGAQGALVAGLHDADVRVAYASAEALRSHPGVVEALAPTLLEGLSDGVKERLAAPLK